ncbi:MAG: acetyltransferase [Deltaproteobacteria bacterium]|nr:acetyltransferase [Deltaproteobacteria bacterium]MBW2361611.1 acetyltransferase [Deltaproteobacteria bacterium]
MNSRPAESVFPRKPGRPLVVLGAGGHARVAADAARAAGCEVAGLLAPDAAAGERIGDWMLLGGDEKLAQPGFVAAHAFVVGIGDAALRRSRSLALRDLGAELASVVHPAATLAPDVGLGAGSVVFAGAVVNTGSRIGDFCIVNTRASIDHDAELADGVQVGPGAVLAGAVHCAADAFIGSGAVVLPGLRVGARAVVGAGAVVTRDVPPDVTVTGNPAREPGDAT